MFDASINSGFTNGGDINTSSQFTEIALLHKSANGYSEIYKAKRFGQWHVLKCLTAEAAKDIKYQTLLEKEFNISYPLSHPNIVRTLGIEHVEGLGWCIILEYIEAEQARSLTHKQASELCDALIYLHEKGIIHRDLKQANILIRRDNNKVVLIDFGLADKSDYTVLKGVAGTSGYIAPELQNDLCVNPRIDIYALGIVLAATTNLKKIAARCSEKNPGKRYASVQEVKKAINYKFPWLSVFLLLLVSITGICFYAIYREYHLLDNNQSSRTENLFGELDSINSQVKIKADSLNITLHELEKIKMENQVLSKRVQTKTEQFDINIREMEIIKEENKTLSNQISLLRKENEEYKNQFQKIYEDWEREQDRKMMELQRY